MVRGLALETLLRLGMGWVRRWRCWRWRKLKIVVTREEMRWRGWGEGQFECFQVIPGGEDDGEVADDY